MLALVLMILWGCLVGYLNNGFRCLNNTIRISTTFLLHVFLKNLNNVIRIILLNGPYFFYYFILHSFDDLFFSVKCFVNQVVFRVCLVE